MPKTSKEIKEEYEELFSARNSSMNTIEIIEFEDFDIKKWYSEDEVKEILNSYKEAIELIKNLKF